MPTRRAVQAYPPSAAPTACGATTTRSSSSRPQRGATTRRASGGGRTTGGRCESRHTLASAQTHSPRGLAAPCAGVRISKADPNPAHRAIALISLPSVRAAHNLAPPTARVTLVTQNIDELSTRALDALVHAGTVDPALAGVDMSVAREEVARAKDEVLEMHGNVWSVVCTDFACQHRERNHDVPITPALPQSAPPPAQDSTNARTEDDAATEAPVAAETSSTPQSPLAALHASLRAPPALRRTGLRPPTPPPPIPAEQLPRCVRCGALARPGEVWFGEAARHMDEVFARVDEADLCIVVGTSATVSCWLRGAGRGR